jgi:hypothetical protein
MASPGPPDPKPAGPRPIDRPASPRPCPGERPLGPDEPSAPIDVPEDLPNPGIGPDVPPGDPCGPDLR